MAYNNNNNNNNNNSCLVDSNRPKIGYLGLLAQLCNNYNREFDTIIIKNNQSLNSSLGAKNSQNDSSKENSLLETSKSNKRKSNKESSDAVIIKRVKSDPNKPFESSETSFKPSKSNKNSTDLFSSLTPFEILSKQEFIRQSKSQAETKNESEFDSQTLDLKFHSQEELSDRFRIHSTQILIENMNFYYRIKTNLNLQSN